MRRLTLPVLCVLLTGVAAGAGVDLGVGQDTAAGLTLTERGDGVWTVEARNPGSTPVHGRFHLSVAGNNTTAFTAWSDLLTLQPGDAVSRTLSAPPRVSGEGAVTFRYGARATPPVAVDAAARSNASRLTIERVHVYPEEVRVAVDAPPDRTVFVTVHDGSTRVFAQQHAATGAGTVHVDVPVHPPLGEEAALTVTAHTRDRRYGTSVTRETPVRTGLAGVILKLVDTVTASPVFTWF